MSGTKEDYFAEVMLDELVVTSSRKKNKTATKSTEVSAEVRAQIEKEYDKIADLPFGKRYKEKRDKNIDTLCTLYGAEASSMLKLAQRAPENFYDTCGNMPDASQYEYKKSGKDMTPHDALNIMLNPQRYERNNSAQELLTGLEKPLEQLKADIAYEKPNVQIDSPVADRSGEIPEDQRKDYINQVAGEYLKIVNAGSYEDKEDLHSKKDALETAQDLCKDYGADALKMVKLAQHHPEEFYDACGEIESNGWSRPKERMEITPKDALSCLYNPSHYERNNSPAQLSACLQESINDPNKIADQSYSPETKKEVQNAINHLDEAMQAQVVKEGKQLGQQLCELYGEKAGTVADAYLDSMAKDGDVDLDDILSEPQAVAEELQLEGDPDKNPANYEKYDSDNKQPYTQETLDNVSNKIANFYEKNMETAKFSKETVNYLCETYGDKAPEILNEVMTYPQNTVKAFGYRSPEDVTIADQVDRLCYDNPNVGEKIMSAAKTRKISADYLASNEGLASVTPQESVVSLASKNNDKDMGIVDVNAEAKPTLTAENLADPSKITNPREWGASLRESTSKSFKNQVTLIALNNSSKTNSEVSTATDAFNARVDERMSKDGKTDTQSKDKTETDILAANIVSKER